MKRISASNIAETLQTIRAEEYPNLPKELIAQIVEIEANYIDDRLEARRQIDALVERYLDSGD